MSGFGASPPPTPNVQTMLLPGRWMHPDSGVPTTAFYALIQALWARTGENVSPIAGTVVGVGALQAQITTLSAEINDLNQLTLLGLLGDEDPLPLVPSPSRLDSTSLTLLDDEVQYPLGYAQLPAEVRNLAPNPFHAGPMVPNELLLLLSFNQTLTMAANMAGLTFLAISPPNADVNVLVDTYTSGSWTNLGTIVIHSTGLISLPTCAAHFFAVGDGLRFVGPSLPNPFLSDFAFALLFKRT